MAALASPPSPSRCRTPARRNEVAASVCRMRRPERPADSATQAGPRLTAERIERARLARAGVDSVLRVAPAPPLPQQVGLQVADLFPLQHRQPRLAVAGSLELRGGQLASPSHLNLAVARQAEPRPPRAQAAGADQQQGIQAIAARQFGQRPARAGTDICAQHFRAGIHQQRRAPAPRPLVTERLDRRQAASNGVRGARTVCGLWEEDDIGGGPEKPGRRGQARRMRRRLPRAQRKRWRW